MTDGLDELVAEYRAEQDRARGDAAVGRRRLLRAVERRQTGRKIAIGSTIVLALIATNSTTWAWSTGRLDPLVGLFASAPVASAGGGGRDRTRVAAPPAASDASREARPTAHATAATVRPDVRQAHPDAPLGAGASDARPLRRAVRARSRDAGDHRAADHRAADHRAGDHRAADHRALRSDAGGHDTATRAEVADRALADALEGLEPPLPSAALPSAALPSAALPSAALPSTAVPSAGELDRRAFARAHRVHFGGRDPVLALAAWDGYLAEFPNGRFVPEARFNRAVTLLRLQRDDDARAALQPFADGAYDGVRMREARALIDALDEGRIRR